MVYVLLQVLGQSIQTLSIGGVALFLPLIRDEVGLTFAQAGALAAVATAVYAAMQIPSGYFADRLGPRRLFIAGLLGSSGLAISFGQLHAYPLFILNQALTGFFRGLVFVPALLLMTSLFPRDRRAMALGLVSAGSFVWIVLLNTFGPLIVDPLGWRTMFVIFGTIGLFGAGLYWRFGGPGPTRSEAGMPLSDMVVLFRHKVMWVLGGIQYIRLAVVMGIGFWLPSLIVLEKGYSLQVAGFLVALGALLTAPSNFIGGYISDRLRNPLSVIGIALSVLAVTTFALAHVVSLPLLALVVAINGLFQQIYFGPLFAVPIEILGQRTAGRTTGFSNFFANVGSFTFAFVIGAFKDITGSFTAGLYSVSAICLVGLVLTVLLSRMKFVNETSDVPDAGRPAHRTASMSQRS